MKVLILSPSEICHSPRLLKAADFLLANGVDVTVYNAITGMADEQVYQSVKTGRKWKIVENDITKRSFTARGRWLWSSILNRLAVDLFKRGACPKSLFPHVLSKAYLLFPQSLKSQHFDVILIHLVDSLPFAALLKKQTGAQLIYDCQEYFKGQYQTEEPFKKKWVVQAENNYAKDADIVLATTHVMLDRLKNEFSGPRLYLRVRNMPARRNYTIDTSTGPCLKIVWHGFDIVPKNIRGVHILLEAVALCKTPVRIYLQGGISEKNKTLLAEMLKEWHIQDKVFIRPLAHPDKIVESLSGYDIGVAGELATQDNQRLTSSNKLFEYINAGLAVLVPDLPGLAETINEYGVGLLYKQGDSKGLAERIDALNQDRPSLAAYKAASVKAAGTELFWENDYARVWEGMQK
jgi:glycosyltransferase involved in cell wall biosynthesis